ncbi:TetR family transcriptional regulator [Corynebacterium poyangense]|uniref:TetR family transcriptional regulator n=2 Tax=Corynebacterium poyangense TaxID=2684405 RepID=A0A7H0SSK2_9CORY|nr:TetR family transcriptional regulator [Corynebacterium poyangense]QNQ91527.1 TetR family transcriptional regulator [Corynebacterium poyangense]
MRNYEDGLWRQFPPLDLHPILAATLQRIHEVGYHATTVRMIAKDVGCTVPALYYHYQNKQAMLVALLDYSMTEAEGRIAAAVKEAGDSAMERLSAAVMATSLYMAYYRELAILDSETRALEPENREKYMIRRDRFEGVFREIIHHGRERGDFATPYPVECARAILAMCQGIGRWFHWGGPDSPEDIAHEYVHLALRMAQVRS